MTREIVLDTETTGLDPASGHRMVELAALELVNHVPTGTHFHEYLDPGCPMPEEAFRIHGLSAEFLAEFPTFAAHAERFLAFIEDSPLVIHNAAFDMRFLNAELARLGTDALPSTRAIDTLQLAQRRFPGTANSLDALCRRFAVDNTARTRHGALLDCELLAEVYLHLIGGRQADLGLALPGTAATGTTVQRIARPPRPFAPTPDELEAHAAFVATLTNPLWERSDDKLL